MKNKVHSCAAINCSKKVDSEKLMCFKHWRMVPSQIQREVLKHYRPGQDISTASEKYMGAFHAAVGAVDEKEKIEKEENQFKSGRY